MKWYDTVLGAVVLGLGLFTLYLFAGDYPASWTSPQPVTAPSWENVTPAHPVEPPSRERSSR